MSDILLHAGERGILIGASGTGKSTLGSHLINGFLAQYPKGYALVLDSKPRYRAQYHVNGMAMNYKGWVKGDTLNEPAVAISDETVKLKQAFQHGRIVLFQGRTENMELVPQYMQRCAEYAQQLFAFSSATRPCLLYIDEFYDVLSGPSGYADPRLLHAVRSGRERNLAVLAGAQRPKSIPLPILTESTNKYIFWLEYEDDKKYLGKHGCPMDAQPVEHQFLYYRLLRGGHKEAYLAQLEKKGEAA